MEQKWGNSPSMPKLDPCSTPSRLDSQDFSFYNFSKSSPKIAIIDFPNMDREKGRDHKTQQLGIMTSILILGHWAAAGWDSNGFSVFFWVQSICISIYRYTHKYIYSLSLSLSLCIYNICNNYYVYMCNIYIYTCIYIYIHVYNLYTSRTRPWQPCSWR